MQTPGDVEGVQGYHNSPLFVYFPWRLCIVRSSSWGAFLRYKFGFLSWGLIFEILQYTYIEFRLPGFQSFILWLLLLNVVIYFFINWTLCVFWLSTFGSTFWNDLCRNLFVSFILVGGFKILAFRTGASLHMPTLRNKDVSFSFAY